MTKTGDAKTQQEKRKRTIEHISKLMETVDEELQKETDSVLQKIENHLMERSEELKRQRIAGRMQSIREALSQPDKIVMFQMTPYKSEPGIITHVSDDNTTVTALCPGRETYSRIHLEYFQAWVNERWHTISRTGCTVESLQKISPTFLMYENGEFYRMSKAEHGYFYYNPLVPVSWNFLKCEEYRIFVAPHPPKYVDSIVQNL